VGRRVGVSVGRRVGLRVGRPVGLIVGRCVGLRVVASAVGLRVGFFCQDSQGTRPVPTCLSFTNVRFWSAKLSCGRRKVSKGLDKEIDDENVHFPLS